MKATIQGQGEFRNAKAFSDGFGLPSANALRQEFNTVAPYGVKREVVQEYAHFAKRDITIRMD